MEETNKPTNKKPKPNQKKTNTDTHTHTEEGKLIKGSLPHHTPPSTYGFSWPKVLHICKFLSTWDSWFRHWSSQLARRILGMAYSVCNNNLQAMSSHFEL